MATRRMTSKEITDSDAFLDLSIGAQALYFHLNQRADDDGFINNPNGIVRLIGARAEDLKALIESGFLIDFNGVVVIKHWLINNQIRADRKHTTKYIDLVNLLATKENGAYTLKSKYTRIYNNQVTTICQPTDNQTQANDGKITTEVRLGKVSIDKDSIESSNKAKRFVKPTLEEVQAYITEKGLNVNAEKFIDYYESNGWKVGRNPMKDWKATVRRWNTTETKTEKPQESDKLLNTIDQIAKGVKK